MREENGCKPADRVLEDGEQERGGGICGCIADADAFEDGSRREQASDGGGEGLEGIEDLVSREVRSEFGVFMEKWTIYRVRSSALN